MITGKIFDLHPAAAISSSFFLLPSPLRVYIYIHRFLLGRGVFSPHIALYTGWAPSRTTIMAVSFTPLMFPEKLSSSASEPAPAVTQDELKRIAAYKAVEFVESGMVVGLGTGSTAVHAVARIAELLRLGELEDVVGVPTSTVTEWQARSLGIPLADLDRHPVVDLAIDGADEVDPALNLVKGRGGSLLREKMVESAARRFVVVVDDSKLVPGLGATGQALPVEIVKHCPDFTRRRLHDMFEPAGAVAKLRTNAVTGELFETDNDNYIVDLYFEKGVGVGDLEAASDAILRLPGVAEHGMFLNMATTLIVAGDHGVTVKNKIDHFQHG